MTNKLFHTEIYRAEQCDAPKTELKAQALHRHSTADCVT